MTTTYKSPAQRLQARIDAKAARLAATTAKAAAYWRASAERLRASGEDERAAFQDSQAVVMEQRLISAGRCIRCGRALSDPKSVAGSIGPECAKKGPR